MVVRFAELYAVAATTTGDPRLAEDLTATAVAALQPRWAELTSAGSPTATARRAVLTAALATTSSASPTGVPYTLGLPGDDSPGADTRASLTAALSSAPATARAALAAAHWWDETPALVAACARTDTDTVRADLVALHHCLADAHAIALARPADEVTRALPAAVADTLDHAVDTLDQAADPFALVSAARTRTARRRRTRVGAATALLVVAAATALIWPGTSAPAPVLPPDAHQWAAITRWAPRGPLVEDDTVTTLVVAAQAADPGAHLLYAGTVGDTIAMVMTSTHDSTPPPAGDPDTAVSPGPGEGLGHLRLWTAPASHGPAALAPTPIDGDDTPRTADVLALTISQDAVGAPPVVLVMTRPTIVDALATTGARPQPDGSTRPVVRRFTLTDGVATFPESPGYPSRVLVNTFSGPPTRTDQDDSHLPPRGTVADLAASQRALLAAVTGHAADTLWTLSALDAPVDLDPRATGDDPGPAHVAVVTTITPDGAWVRTARVSGATDDTDGSYPEHLAAVPATDPAHALLPATAGADATFIALAPDAATAALVTTTGHVRDTATISNGLAVLSSTKDPAGTIFRLRLRAPDGHVVYDQIPPASDELVP